MSDLDQHEAGQTLETEAATTVSLKDSAVRLAMVIDLSCEKDSMPSVLKAFYAMVSELLQNCEELHSIHVEPQTQDATLLSPLRDA